MPPNKSPRLSLHATFLNATVRILKPRTAHCLPLAASALDAVKLFATAKVGSVLILDDSDRLRGIFTERDLVTKFDPQRELARIKLPEVMASPVEHIRSTSSITRLLHIFSHRGFRHAVILDSHSAIPRAISVRDILYFIHEALLNKMASELKELTLANAEELRTFFNLPLNALHIDRPPILVSVTAMVSDAIFAMQQGHCACVLVVDAANEIVGIFSERDLALRVYAAGLNPSETKLQQVMTASPITLSGGAGLGEAVSLMVTKGFRHIPIRSIDSAVVSILSVDDIVKTLSENA